MIRLGRKIEKIGKTDWKDWKDRLKRLGKQNWEERLKGLKKQDWKDWEDKIEERLHQSYQSSSIYINLKNINSWHTLSYSCKKLSNIKNSQSSFFCEEVLNPVKQPISH